MTALLGTHILLYWLADEGRLSSEQKHVLAGAPPLVNRVGISPAVAAEVARLPDSFRRDPADRIIVATAMVLGAVLLTNDRRIREAALVPTV